MPRGVPRPPDEDYLNEFDIDQVVNGSPPYPTLSWSDNRVAWARLEERGLTARRIAERLQVTPRTIVRWRKAKREGRQ